jgi:NAD(P)-dependent dehydrogenase (short-subunit alcohol dehydrogenase family)
MTQRIALVTGASRGIGRGIAIALSGAGYDVIVNFAGNLKAAEETRAEIESRGRKALLAQADISSATDRQRLVDESFAWAGRLDLLVNNAGVAPEVRADLLEATEASFDRLININLKGPYFLTQLIARRWVETSDGATKRQSDDGKTGHNASSSPPTLPRIINITSISAFTASVNRGDYCIAKAGLAMMTQLFAARLAEHGINVYEIRPGVIETDMTGPVKAKYDKMILEDGLIPIRRWGKPDDIARAVVAIATDLLPFSTGEVINVDGGFHLRRL